MRKLAQTLLITIGCFAVTGIFASTPEEPSSEVVVSTDDDQNTTDNEDPSFCGCGCGKPKN